MLGPLLYRCTITLLLLWHSQIHAGPGPRPVLQWELLKSLEGTWEAEVKLGEDQYKGTMTYKVDLGGMWLVGELQVESDGMTLTGKIFETYDAAKKKYIRIWIDSTSASPLIAEGSFDNEGRVVTFVGEVRGADGKPAKFKSTTELVKHDGLARNGHCANPSCSNGANGGSTAVAGWNEGSRRRILALLARRHSIRQAME